MPKPNKARTINVERNLAQRVEALRVERGWTYEGLAAKLRDAGCAINSSAVHRSLKGDPPRKIVVDELAAYSRVFEVSVVDLLVPAEVLATKRARIALEQWVTLVKRASELQEEMDALDTAAEKAFDTLRGLIDVTKETRVEVEAALWEFAVQSELSERGARRATRYRMYELTNDDAYRIGIEDLIGRRVAQDG